MAKFKLKQAYSGVVGGVRHILEKGDELLDEELATLIELDQPGTVTNAKALDLPADEPTPEPAPEPDAPVEAAAPAEPAPVEEAAPAPEPETKA